MIATAITLPVTAYAVHAGHVRGITHHITAKDALNQEIAPIITTLCKGHTP